MPGSHYYVRPEGQPLAHNNAWRRPANCIGGSRGARVALALARGVTHHDDLMVATGMHRGDVAYGLDECEALGLLTRERGRQGTTRPTFAVVVGPWLR